MKILFISRAYPPVIGGIENHNYELAKHLGKIADTTLLVNTKGKKFLPLFLPYALCKTLVTAHKYDAILLGDGVLSIIGFFVKLFSVRKRPRVASVVHGLDITYRNPVYQTLWVKMFLPALDTLIAVSEETKKIAIQFGLEDKRIPVIANGVTLTYEPKKYTRESLQKLLQKNLSEKTILLTHGRLAKRKGVAWFLHNVLPSLPKNILYVVSGDGPERNTIEETITEHGLEDQVILLGRIDEETKLLLLHSVDLFIQPNITVPGDMEGFGIAVIEATGAARVVIASNIEGLSDAIANGKNGVPVPSGDTIAWREAILDLKKDPDLRERLGKEFQLYTQTNFSWDEIAKKYLSALQ